MIINYERITKNLTQFIIDFFRSKEIELNKQILVNEQKSFEEISRNLKTYDFELIYDNSYIKQIVYKINENETIIKSIIRNDNNNIIEIKLSGNIPEHNSFKSIKKIVRNELNKIVSIIYTN